MWVYTKSRGEKDKRFLLNLDICSRINISQLGEKWFLEVILGSDSFPIAALNSQEEAETLMQHIFDHFKEEGKAIDLDASPAQLKDPPKDEKK